MLNYQNLKAHRLMAVAVALVAMLMGGPAILVACGGMNSASGTQPGALLSQTDLPVADERVQALQALPEIAPVANSVDWKTATLNAYHGLREQTITAAVAGSSRALIAAFRPNAERLEFRAVLLEIVPEQGRSAAAGFAGTATVFAPNGELLSQATFRDGRVVEVREGDADSRGVDWRCFKDCVRNAWSRLPGWLKSVCGGACAGCLRGAWWSCPACAGCLGGYIAGCLRDCWR